MPGLDPLDARPVESGSDVDAALVVDSDQRNWLVQAPRSDAAGAALEAEAALLAQLGEHVASGALPFAVPEVAGWAPLPAGGRACVHRAIPGRPLRLEQLTPGPGLAVAVGRAIGAIHELPTKLADEVTLASYDAEEYRTRRLVELDEAAQTGNVPANLMRRWELALENVAFWRFSTTVIHGDLTANHVLLADGAVSGVIEWAEAKVADPADDFAWLFVAAPPQAMDSVLEAYAMARREEPDRHLATRAILAGELALARWLMHGVRNDNAEIIADAVSMLTDLSHDVGDELFTAQGN